MLVASDLLVVIRLLIVVWLTCDLVVLLLMMFAGIVEFRFV